MSYITYEAKRFSPSTMAIIEQARDICAEYYKAGYELTLRQLYYQFVAKGLLANKQSEYKRLGSIITDARYAGEISWQHIADRTRNAQLPWIRENSREVISQVPYGLAYDLWKDQFYYVEVWVEKDALVDVVRKATQPYRVGYFACRGYVSASEMWSAGQRFIEAIHNGKKVVIIHLGDHDPSGIDMTRDLAERLDVFTQYEFGMAKDAHTVDVDRIALSMAQIQQYNPPPNPAKTTDARFAGYMNQYGEESWELDALDPRVLDELIQQAILKHIDIPLFNQRVQAEGEARNVLHGLVNRWDEVKALLTAQKNQ